MNSSVNRLIYKYALTEANCVYCRDEIGPHLAGLRGSSILYTVAHGANDVPLMMQGSSGPGRITTPQVAEMLLAGLRDRANKTNDPPSLQVKLGMCFGAKEITFSYKDKVTEQMVSTTNSFARLAANKLYQLNDSNPNALDLSDVFIGGCDGEIRWFDDPSHSKMVQKTENVRTLRGQIGFRRLGNPIREARSYYSPDHYGGYVEAKPENLPSKKFKHVGQVSFYCWFPFEYEYVLPRRKRTTKPFVPEDDSDEVAEFL
jgi:hypothetical protein